MQDYLSPDLIEKSYPSTTNGKEIMMQTMPIIRIILIRQTAVLLATMEQ